MSIKLPWQQAAIIQHSQRLLNSFQYWTGQPLLPPDASPALQAKTLFTAPFVVVSHGSEADPIFNYGNAQALALWQFDWDTFTQLPSRQSAAPIAQAERAQLLAEAKAKGYISNYRGIRINRAGQRFAIANVILWAVLDDNQQAIGQAATFDQWEFID
jgi:MEKHLA domain